MLVFSQQNNLNQEWSYTSLHRAKGTHLVSNLEFDLMDEDADSTESCLMSGPLSSQPAAVQKELWKLQKEDLLQVD